MTRGIHLKRLTRGDLGLLGLTESQHQPEGSPLPRPDDAQGSTRASAPSKIAESRPSRTAAPPPNPRLPFETSRTEATSDPESDLTPAISLELITREIRLGLEETLRVLDRASNTQDQA